MAVQPFKPSRLLYVGPFVTIYGMLFLVAAALTVPVTVGGSLAR